MSRRSKSSEGPKIGCSSSSTCPPPAIGAGARKEEDTKYQPIISSSANYASPLENVGTIPTGEAALSEETTTTTTTPRTHAMTKESSSNNNNDTFKSSQSSAVGNGSTNDLKVERGSLNSRDTIEEEIEHEPREEEGDQVVTRGGKEIGLSTHETHTRDKQNHKDDVIPEQKDAKDKRGDNGGKGNQGEDGGKPHPDGKEASKSEAISSQTTYVSGAENSRPSGMNMCINLHHPTNPDQPPNITKLDSRSVFKPRDDTASNCDKGTYRVVPNLQESFKNNPSLISIKQIPSDEETDCIIVNAAMDTLRESAFPPKPQKQLSRILSVGHDVLMDLWNPCRLSHRSCDPVEQALNEDGTFTTLNGASPQPKFNGSARRSFLAGPQTSQTFADLRTSTIGWNELQSQQLDYWGDGNIGFYRRMLLTLWLFLEDITGHYYYLMVFFLVASVFISIYSMSLEKGLGVGLMSFPRCYEDATDRSELSRGQFPCAAVYRDKNVTLSQCQQECDFEQHCSGFAWTAAKRHPRSNQFEPRGTHYTFDTQGGGHCHTFKYYDFLEDKCGYADRPTLIYIRAECPSEEDRTSISSLYRTPHESCGNGYFFREGVGKSPIDTVRGPYAELFAENCDECAAMCSDYDMCGSYECTTKLVQSNSNREINSRVGCILHDYSEPSVGNEDSNRAFCSKDGFLTVSQSQSSSISSCVNKYEGRGCCPTPEGIMVECCADEGAAARADRNVVVHINYFVNILLTIEVVLRFWSYPCRSRFVLKVVNVFDVFAVLPFWIKEIGGGEGIFGICDVFVCLFRLVKLCRYFDDWEILQHSIRDSASALKIPIFFLFVIVFLFACGVFLVEVFSPQFDNGRDQSGANRITTFKEALYYCIVCIVSIDVSPVFQKKPLHEVSRVMAIMMMFLGVIFMAMPIAVVGNCFSQAWNDRDRIILIAKFRSRMGQKGFLLNDLSDIFNEVDVDRSGSIEFQEFQRMVEVFLNMTNQKTIRSLFSTFDICATGAISYEDFVCQLFPELPEKELTQLILDREMNLRRRTTFSDSVTISTELPTNKEGISSLKEGTSASRTETSDVNTSRSPSFVPAGEEQSKEKEELSTSNRRISASNPLAAAICVNSLPKLGQESNINEGTEILRTADSPAYESSALGSSSIDTLGVENPYFSRSESKASQNATMKSMASKRRLSLLHPTAMMSGGQHGVKAPRLRATQESPNFLKLNTRLLTIEEKLNRIMTHLSMSTSNPNISASFGNQNTSIALSDVSEMYAKNAAAGPGGSRRGSAGTSCGAPTRRRSDIVPQQFVAQSLDIPQDAHHQNSNNIRSARHISHPSSAGYGAGTKRSMSVTSTTGFHNPGKRQSLTYGASSTSVSQNLPKSTHDFLDYANMKHRAVEPPAVGNSTAVGYLTGMMNSLSGNTYSRRGSVSSRVGHSAIDRLDGVLKSPAASRRGSSRTTSSNSTNSKVNKMNQINDRLGALQLGKVVNTSSMEFELNKSPSGTPSASPSKTNIMPPRDDYQDGIGAKKSGNTMSPSPSLGSSYPLADVHRNRTN